MNTAEMWKYHFDNIYNSINDTVSKDKPLAHILNTISIPTIFLLIMCLLQSKGNIRVKLSIQMALPWKHICIVFNPYLNTLMNN